MLTWADQSRVCRTTSVCTRPAPQVECIGKGKASTPYEFGVKASIVTTNGRAPGGQFVLHAKAVPGNPYDGHTVAEAIEATEKLTGCPIERAYVDKGYRGHKPQTRAASSSPARRVGSLG